VFASTQDGFQLAEHDLKLRGPGDLLGTRQIGLPPFRIADLVRDADIVGIARNLATELIAHDPELHSPEHARLKKLVQQRHGEDLGLSDVG
jgi:ATP-dependent DNA helicase RecG